MLVSTCVACAHVCVWVCHCRIRLTAEKTADEFQLLDRNNFLVLLVVLQSCRPSQHPRFVPVKKWFSSPQMCDMWTLDEEIQKKCTVYVRYLDRWAFV